MPAHNRQPAPQAGGGAQPKTTAKYTNKDGTKYIEVPKSSASTPPAQPSPTTTASSRGGPSANQLPPATSDPQPTPHVNPKKQKRRAKAAAKAAAKQAQEAASNGLPSPASTASAPPPPSSLDAPAKDSPDYHPSQGQHDLAHHLDEPGDWGEETESEDGEHHDPNGTEAPNSKKSSKKKKKKAAPNSPAPARPSGMSKEKIWNTSGPEERERIKQFWLGLKEDERKSLVKVEKDTVLKKMKEQQKHTCSCSVCGRKRTAIEEELEGLYDAYYEELESFANQPHNHPDGPSMFGGTKRFGPMAGLHPPGAVPARYTNHHPSRGRIVEHVDNDDEEDEEDDGEGYSEEDDLDDEEDDEDEPEEIPRDSLQQDFFTFGQSLTVKGGILTVADDLLKNDGKKFIEMMEQLAERRMAREEDAKDHYAPTYGGHSVNGGNIPNPHNHPSPEEEEYEEEEEEEEEFDESQDEDYEEEEDAMTEEQRMEEGRRMFQIFAARMFEQRVLTAYREKVARERQDKLLEELEQEDNKKQQQAAKKAKEAQKKKDRAAQKKQAQLEEKAKREAQKAAEEAARLAEEQKKAEEAKRKAAEKRKKKDAQRKAEEEDRLKKEAERQRRALEQREKQAEQERKAREAKERERKLKEEQRRKEQEARELKERETRERREKHEKDKREKEQRAAQAKAEREAKEMLKQEEKATQKAATTATAIPTQPAKKQHPVSIPALPQHVPTNHPSPQIAVATPALPKAPTPMKPRSVSHEVPRSVSQASYSGSGPSQAPSPHPLTPVHSSPAPIGPPSKTPSAGPMNAVPPMQPVSPFHATAKSPPGFAPNPFNNIGGSPMGMQYPLGLPPMSHGGFGRIQEQLFHPTPLNYRPGGIQGPPPGLGGPIGSRPFPPPSQLPPGFGFTPEPMPAMHHSFSHHPESVSPPRPSPHSRQASASFEPSSLDTKGSSSLASSQPIPIGKPTPIGRPASVVHGQQRSELSTDIDEVSDHLGSSALLDETDFPLDELTSHSIPRHIAPGPGPVPPQMFPGPPLLGQPFSSVNPWGQVTTGFSPPPSFSNPHWTPRPTFGIPTHGMRQPRSITIRQMLVQACKDLANHAADPNGYIILSAIKGHVDSITPPDWEPVVEQDLLDMCETEGNAQNGGGSFETRRDDQGKVSIRFDPNINLAPTQVPLNVGAPGQITSPAARHARLRS